MPTLKALFFCRGTQLLSHQTEVAKQLHATASVPGPDAFSNGDDRRSDWDELLMGQTMVEQDSTLSRSLTVTEDPAATPNGGIRQEITFWSF